MHIHEYNVIIKLNAAKFVYEKKMNENEVWGQSMSNLVRKRKKGMGMKQTETMCIPNTAHKLVAHTVE